MSEIYLLGIERQIVGFVTTEAEANNWMSQGGATEYRWITKIYQMVVV